KIKRIVLGTSYNDIPTNDLKPINLTISKLAGSPREKEYLDAMYPQAGGTHFVNPKEEREVRLFEVAEMEKEKLEEKKEKNKEFKVEVVGEVNDELVNQLAEVEEAAFPPEMRLGEETIRSVLKSETPQIILKLNNKPAAYILTIPATEMGTGGKDALYIWDIGARPEVRGIKTIKALYDKLIEEAKRRKYKKLTAHVRVSQHLSDVLQKRYGWKFIKRIENWAGFNEPFDYLEYNLEE
ncbi:GNAT family N-acetyltransferase, partial [bacterium]|nr:GNAT family N-acetyltransferase [bacterium]